jgi:hypothetical protein
LINECSDIAKDWGVIKDSISDSLGEDSLTVRVEFDITYSSPIKKMAGGEDTTTRA